MSQSNGSRVELAATESVNDTRDKARNQPDIFYGDRPKLDKWLFQMDLYLKAKKVPADERAENAMTFMRGRAEDWVIAKYKAAKEEDAEEEAKELIGNYATFKEALRQVFGIGNEEKIASLTIRGLRQRTSAADYAAEFQRYAAKLDWGDEALMEIFQDGLKDGVKDQLIFWPGTIDNLTVLTQTAIEIDDKLYERVLEKRNKHFEFNKNYAQKLSERKPYNNTRGNHYGEPMEIDMAQVKKPFNRKNKKEDPLMGTKKCYSCGKPGHFARNCRSRNMMPPRQINMVMTEENDSRDEFEDTPWGRAWERKGNGDVDALDGMSDDSDIGYHTPEPLRPKKITEKATAPSQHAETQDKDQLSEQASSTQGKFPKAWIEGADQPKDKAFLRLDPRAWYQQTWTEAVISNQHHPNHVLIASGQCMDENCAYFGHQEHGTSQPKAADSLHPQHRYIRAELCLDHTCTLHNNEHWEEVTNEEVSDDETWVRINDEIENIIGKNVPTHLEHINDHFKTLDTETKRSGKDQYSVPRADME